MCRPAGLFYLVWTNLLAGNLNRSPNSTTCCSWSALFNLDSYSNRKQIEAAAASSHGRRLQVRALAGRLHKARPPLPQAPIRRRQRPPLGPPPRWLLRHRPDRRRRSPLPLQHRPHALPWARSPHGSFSTPPSPFESESKSRVLAWLSNWVVQVEEHFGAEGLSVVGYYHANERADDSELRGAAKNIGDHIFRCFPRAAVLLVRIFFFRWENSWMLFFFLC